jgi:hypothetical protein
MSKLPTAPPPPPVPIAVAVDAKDDLRLMAQAAQEIARAHAKVREEQIENERMESFERQELVYTLRVQAEEEAARKEAEWRAANPRLVKLRDDFLEAEQRRKLDVVRAESDVAKASAARALKMAAGGVAGAAIGFFFL